MSTLEAPHESFSAFACSPLDARMGKLFTPTGKRSVEFCEMPAYSIKHLAQMFGLTFRKFFLNRAPTHRDLYVAKLMKSISRCTAGNVDEFLAAFSHETKKQRAYPEYRF